ncbi:MAG: hypothetical protein U5K51_03585 [Flavobacteriaceae bacterium]|nr:hypothetical protein [Flavobacteriaceae bacterium]
MKTTKQFLILSVFLLIFLSENSFAQELRTITLYVNTGSLTHNRDVDQYANFGQEAGILNKDYTVEVNLNDEIEWVGVSSSAPETDSVYITKIKHQKKSKLLDSDDINGEKVVKAKVTKGNSGDEEKYDIHFKIISASNPQNRSFNIDPVLKVK